jgi:hypothetical protein
LKTTSRVATTRWGVLALAARLLACAAILTAVQSHAALTVLVGEPFGSFGTMMPVGHAGVYLDKVCADTPIHLRPCHAGEMGVVIARYHRVQQYDWLAVPILPFLYGVDQPEDVPQFMTPSAEAELRESYRQEHLRSIVPDGDDGGPAEKGEWVETIGVAFDRKVWGYRVETTAEQDQRLIDTLNDRPNVRAYRLRTANCADFAASIVNLYFPGAIRRNKISDFGLMTPKQLARAMAAYGNRHPEARSQIVEVPQIPGTLRRSRPIWGVAEAGLKTKRYLLTLLVIQPEVVATLGVAYLHRGRWRVGQGAVAVGPEIWMPPGVESIAAKAAAPVDDRSSGILR